MAAFSYKFQNNAVDYSVQNVLQIPPPIKMQEPNTTTNTMFICNINNINNACPQMYSPTDPGGVYVGCFKANDEAASLAYKITCTDDSSSVTDHKLQTCTAGVGEQQQQQQVTKAWKSKEELFSVDSSPSQEKKMYGKRKKRSINNGVVLVMKKVEEEKKKKKREEKKVEEATGGGGGYIHVRARRGQATDNHSLAERVRREKISERMKMLQALVPGCDKVTGKALMLDEIINYVQSLQNQVEFLSMKLASLNPMFYDFGLMDLDSFINRPHQTLCSLEPPLHSLEQVLQNMHQMQPPMLYHDTLPNIANNCGQVVDSSSAFQFLPQDNNIDPHHQAKGQVLWDVDDEQRYILGNQQQQQQQGFTNSNLYSLQYYIE